MQTTRQVVITGLGALTPIGNTLASFWDGLMEGKSGAGPISYFDATKFRTHFACELKDYDPKAFFDRKEIRKTDPYSQYAMVASDEAIADAGIKSINIDPYRVGVLLSTGIGGFNTFESEMESFFSDPSTPRINPFFISKIIPNMSAGLISLRHGFKGVNYNIVSACSSSTHAIMDAYHQIALGKADMMVTGGSEAPITQMGVGGFSSMKALSSQNDDPETASRPFDKHRNGFVLGEGAGILVLEEKEHALKRGAKVYAEVVGVGATADAYHITASDPEGEGILRAMNQCIEEAGIKPEQLDYINAHATSTPVGDISELKAIDQFLQGSYENTYVSSTKSMTGHLLGGAGAIESIVSIMSIEKGMIPPTTNHEERDPELPSEVNIVFDKPFAKEVQYAMCNNFAFGGHNASVLFKKPS